MAQTSKASNRVRIGGGAWRSRLLHFVDAPGLRPTPDRVRQTVFNWLGQELGGLACLDLFSGTGVTDADGTEWYFPQRLSDDLGAVGNGTPSAAEQVLGLHATLGRHLPRRLRIYAFGARLGGTTILNEARSLAVQSHIPLRQVTLVDRHAGYAHNDPNGAYPRNAFFAHLIPFLDKIAAP